VVMDTIKRLFRVNQGNTKRVMIQCRTEVKRDAVRRETIDGVEHIIVSSATLPDDVVMNGGLYPADEIASAFNSLELTLAPVEHPTDADGNFISANDPRAIHNFHAGAFNMNVRQENGRVLIDKYINVSEAMKTDRGKRLLDRVKELETNDQARPIHTSVGVFVSPEQLGEPMTNAEGNEYTWIARNMVFDHDAILLDSVGAAQPHQGVGVAVNSKGDKCAVEIADLTPEPTNVRIAANASFSEINQAVSDALERSAINADWIEELFDDRVIFYAKETLFEVPYVLDENGRVTIVGIPLPVERDVAYIPKTNSEGDAMKELILNALKEAGIETEGKSDADLFKAFQGLHANQSDSSDKAATNDEGIAEVVANALAPLADKLASVEAKLNHTENAELDRLAGIVGNSDKYPGLDTEGAKKLGVDTLKSMAANCASAYGVSPVINAGAIGEDQTAPASMPE
jgi:hypothetical protein